MKKTYPHIALATILMCPSAWAGKLTTTYMGLNEGNAVALLESSSQRHIDALRRIVIAKYSGTHSARRWEHLESHMRHAPITRMEYEYPSGGARSIRVYHAIGGDPLGLAAQNFLQGDSGLAYSSSDDSESDSWSDDEADAGRQRSASEDARVAMESEDDRFYAGFDDTDVRAPFRSSGRTKLSAHWTGTYHHALDAEHKALRSLEEDILEGRLPQGGIVRGISSGNLCASCRYSIEQFAKAYDLDIRLTEMPARMSVRMQKELVDTGRARLKGLRLVDTRTGQPLIAYDMLASSRDAQVRESLSPNSLRQSSSGGEPPQRVIRYSESPSAQRDTGETTVPCEN